MQIRCGRRKYNKDGSFTDPSFEGFKNIICMTASTEYGSIGPYCLKDENGQIMENIWQFSKIYESVPKTKEKYSRYNDKIIWEHPEEIHVTDGKLNDNYLNWRKKGFECKYPVRYPVGFHGRDKCIGAIKDISDVRDVKNNPLVLDYISSRKEIYLPVYSNLVRKEEKYKQLQKILEKNNILIIEVDGPHQESLKYYKEKYQVNDDFIVNDTILVNKENMNILLNDSKHPFGHGYCLSLTLLEDNK